MSEGSGQKGRVGDATRARIDDLKDGWSVSPAEPSAGKRKGTTQPPPTPPTNIPPIQRRKKSASVPPPLPVRAKQISKPPPLPPRDEPSVRVATERVAPDLPRVQYIKPALPATSAVARHGGVLGDMAYVFRVLAKKRAANAELAQLGKELAAAKEARNHKLLELARQAVGDIDNEQTLVGRARESLLEIEERRSAHAGKVAAADEEIVGLAKSHAERSRDREDRADALQTELQKLSEELLPLEEQLTALSGRSTEITKQLATLDGKIQGLQRKLGSSAGPEDSAGIHATIASLRAERDAIADDEPLLARESARLHPCIEELLGRQSLLKDKATYLAQERSGDKIRVAEKEEAVKASRTVESRAADDQASKRHEELLELGQALHHKSSAAGARVRSIERYDTEIGELEHRRMVLCELLSSVETWPFVRGIVLLLVVLGLTATGIWLLALR